MANVVLGVEQVKQLAQAKIDSILSDRLERNNALIDKEIERFRWWNRLLRKISFGIVKEREYSREEIAAYLTNNHPFHFPTFLYEGQLGRCRLILSAAKATISNTMTLSKEEWNDIGR